MSAALERAADAIGDLAESDSDEVISNREYAAVAVRAYLDALDADDVATIARFGDLEADQVRSVLQVVRP